MVKVPALFVELCELFGAQAALGVYRRLGGQILGGWLPRHTRALEAELGPELARKIVWHLSGDGGAPAGQLEFHVGWLLDVHRDARVYAMATNGLPLVAVAAVAGTSQRHVRRILDGDAAGQKQAA